MLLSHFVYRYRSEHSDKFEMKKKKKIAVVVHLLQTTENHSENPDWAYRIAIRLLDSLACPQEKIDDIPALFRKIIVRHRVIRLFVNFG